MIQGDNTLGINVLQKESNSEVQTIFVYLQSDRVESSTSPTKAMAMVWQRLLYTYLYITITISILLPCCLLEWSLGEKRAEVYSRWLRP